MGSRAKTTALKMGQRCQSRGQGQGQKLMTKHGRKGGKGKNDTTEAKIGQKYQFWGQGQNLDRQDTTDTNVRAKLSSAHVKDYGFSVKMMLTQWGLHCICLQCKRLCPKLSLFVSFMWRGWDLRSGGLRVIDHFEIFWTYRDYTIFQTCSYSRFQSTQMK